MNNYKDSKYLPLGTVVLLKNGKNKIMIIGFAVIEKDQDRIFDYLGCLYPEGVLSSDKNLLFDNNDIETVVSLGYVDDTEKKFKEKLIIAVDKVKSTK